MPSGVDEVRAAIAAAVPAWLGPGCSLFPERFVAAERDWSFEFHFDVLCDDGSIVPCRGKIPRWAEAPALEDVLAAGPQPAVGVEYSTLEEIAAMVAHAEDPGLVAIEPVGLIADHNLIVTRHLDAQPLRRHARRPRRGPQRIDHILRRAGRWLRRYHDEVGSARRGTPGPEHLVPPPPPEGLRVGGYLEFAGAVRSEMGAFDEIELGDLHGDVSSNNVLVASTGAVALLDPNRRHGMVLEDVAHLVAELRAGRVRALSSGRIPGRGVTDGRVRALLGGYGSPDPAVLGPLVARDLMVRWVDLERRLASRGAGAVRAAVRRHFQREVEAALSGR